MLPYYSRYTRVQTRTPMDKKELIKVDILILDISIYKVVKASTIRRTRILSGVF